MTTLEKAAWMGFNYYWNEICYIWKLYKRYGDTILEKDLEKEDENLKKIFVESDNNDLIFQEKVCDYWEANYHFVANNYDELVKLFMRYKATDRRITRLLVIPDSKKYRNGETRGNDLNYAISEEFYKKAASDIKSSKRDELILVYSDKKMCFRVSFNEKKEKTFNELMISDQVKAIHL